MARVIDLVFLHRDHKGSTRWLEPTLARVRAMSERYGSDPEFLVTQAWTLYAGRSPALGLWAGIEDEQVVGHAYAVIQQWDGKWVGWLSQAELDHPVSVPYRAMVMRAMEEWIGRFNALYRDKGMAVDGMMMVTPRMNSPFARHSGWEPYRVMHRRPLSPVAR